MTWYLDRRVPELPDVDAALELLRGKEPVGIVVPWDWHRKWERGLETIPHFIRHTEEGKGMLELIGNRLE